MGQYKVPQNVEAEDKILGPLTIKQFIYIVIALMWGFIAIRLIAPFSLVVGLLLTLPVSGVFLALGLIQREGVSFENYFLASVRYFFYPRRLMWVKDENPDIIKNAPKKNIQTEDHKTVTQGQLKQLAFIVDTRGNYKDPNLQLADATNQAAQLGARVLDPESIQATQVPNASQAAQPIISSTDDVLDENSTRSTDVGELLQNQEANLRERAVAKMQQALHAVPKEAKTQAAPATDMPPEPQKSASGGTLSSAQVTDAVMRLAQQSDHLSVQRLAAQANKAIPLTEGQIVQIR